MPVMNSREYQGSARIKVLGVGGGGSNAVSRMFRDRMPGVEYIVINTDAQALVKSDVPLKIRIGDQLTGGKGVGGDPEMGMRSAEESREELYEAVRDSDMIFVAAGMGGGTGTGSAPVLAQIAKVIQKLPNSISIAGHTDASPFDRRGYTNWELSTDRANASRRALVSAGVELERVVKVIGHADMEPLTPEDPFAVQNRRISIVLLREVPVLPPELQKER